MAPKSGTENSVVDVEIAPAEIPSALPALPSTPFAFIERELQRRPGLFDFFQAVRLILRILPDRAAVGQFVKPRSEAVRFNVHNALGFPPSEIFEIDWTGPYPRMVVNFMGLTGPMGVLPYPYSELIADRIRSRDRTLAAFFDIFNHRMISHFYQAWEKYRAWVAYERDGQDRISKYLMCLIGQGTDGLERRLIVRDESLLFYTGLLSLHPRSAAALEQILEDYFGVPAEVEQFVGAWQPLDRADHCIFDTGDSLSEQLGVGAVVGDEIWDQQSRIRLKLGPLTQAQYLGFLPSGDAIDPLRDLARIFCGRSLEIEVQLILKRDEVPRCDLGEEDLAGPRLGWFTWMKSGADFDRSPADTILQLA